MIGLTLTLIAVGLIGIAMLYLLFVPALSWNWKSARVKSDVANKNLPFFLFLITILSFAAIVFCVHALLVVHGVLK